MIHTDTPSHCSTGLTDGANTSLMMPCKDVGCEETSEVRRTASLLSSGSVLFCLFIVGSFSVGSKYWPYLNHGNEKSSNFLRHSVFAFEFNGTLPSNVERMKGKRSLVRFHGVIMNNM